MMAYSLDNAREAIQKAGVLTLLAAGLNLPRTPLALAELPLPEPDANSLVPGQCPAPPSPASPHQLQPSDRATQALLAALVAEDKKEHQTRAELSPQAHPDFVKLVEKVYQDAADKSAEAGVAYIPPPPQKIYVTSMPYTGADYPSLQSLYPDKEGFFFSGNTTILEVSSTFLTLSPDKQKGVLAHEFAHAISQANPGINLQAQVPVPEKVKEFITKEAVAIAHRLNPSIDTGKLQDAARKAAASAVYADKREETYADHFSALVEKGGVGPFFQMQHQLLEAYFPKHYQEELSKAGWTAATPSTQKHAIEEKALIDFVTMQVTLKIGDEHLPNQIRAALAAHETACISALSSPKTPMIKPGGLTR